MFSEAVKNKLSCAAFFFLPGLSYSLVTSRMPAIKESAQIDDLQLGIALFLPRNRRLHRTVFLFQTRPSS